MRGKKQSVQFHAFVRPSARGMWSGFLMGIGALTMLGAPQFNPPRYPGEGVGADWRSVGKEMRNALRRYDEIRDR
ncbi:hypothetical protein [Azospirillum thermophilum]|uniref:hypothetical protein n=1 Tax=Azospirillum thermophilum TaxID=2202148 RepID=UPI00143CC85F|nr:hypothetical protein [Azospirillum thermophilum]